MQNKSALLKFLFEDAVIAFIEEIYYDSKEMYHQFDSLIVGNNKRGGEYDKYSNFVWLAELRTESHIINISTVMVADLSIEEFIYSISKYIFCFSTSFWFVNERKVFGNVDAAILAGSPMVFPVISSIAFASISSSSVPRGALKSSSII